MAILVKGTSCHLEDSVTFNIDFEDFVDCNLTYREISVSTLMFSGYSIKDIAKQENVSRRYVTTIVKNLRSKYREFLNNYG